MSSSLERVPLSELEMALLSLTLLMKCWPRNLGCLVGKVIFVVCDRHYTVSFHLQTQSPISKEAAESAFLPN